MNRFTTACRKAGLLLHRGMRLLNQDREPPVTMRRRDDAVHAEGSFVLRRTVIEEVEWHAAPSSENGAAESPRT